MIFLDLLVRADTAAARYSKRKLGDGERTGVRHAIT